MLLDAPTFELVLTPEAALGMIQKEVARKGWRKYEVEEIRLVYTPFYSFAFDVEGDHPVSGKAALNANSGELNEFVPMVLDKPLKRTKNTDEGGEVEETTVSASEVKDIAKAKIASQTGIKKELVTISAVSKTYLPFFRIWLSVHDEVHRIEVDALLGAPMGLEDIPERTKTFEEKTEETLKKLKTPAGIVEVGGKAVSGIGGIVSGKGVDAAGGILGSKTTRWVVMGAVILILLFLTFGAKKSGVTCDAKILDFGNSCVLDGECKLTNDDKDLKSVQAKISVFESGRERLDLGDIVGAQVPGGTTKDTAFIVPVNVTWSPEGKDCRRDFSWKYEQLG